MSSSFTNAFFGGLSISSLASDDYSENNDDKSVQSQVELYRRLQELELMTNDLLCDKNLHLSLENDSFAEVELNSSHNFELFVPTFDHSQVMLIGVTCLPDCKDQVSRSLVDSSCPPSSWFPSLDIVLKRENSSVDSYSEEFVPVQFGQKYSFALTTAHNFGAGRYTMNIQMGTKDAHKLYQPIRISCRVAALTRTTPIEIGSTVTGTVSLSEFKYYRFLHKEPHKMIHISLQSTGKQGDSDLDLYASNAHDGIIDVTKENCIWKSTQSGGNDIFIHPDDPNVSRGSYYIIGVFGCLDLNQYKLTVTTMQAPDIVDVAVDTRFDFNLTAEYTFFRMVLNPSSPGYLSIAITTTDHEQVSNGSLLAPPKLPRDCGASVYTNDFFPISFKDEKPVIHSGVSSAISCAPVAFVSANCMYPTATNYSWKAAGQDNIARFEVEINEIKYLSNVIYFSVCKLNYDCAKETVSSTRCVIFTKEVNQLLREDARRSARKSLFDSLYADVDPDSASFSDRANIHMDESSLTYGEIDFLSFQELIDALKLQDGLTFYDLGCGAGKAVVSAALSNTLFHRCIGIECLSSLVAISSNVTEKARRLMSSHNIAHRSNNSSQRNQFPSKDENELSRSLVAAFSSTIPLMEIRQGDILQESWTDGDFIFISSLCFSDNLISSIFDACKHLKVGTIVATQKLPENYSKHFDMMKTFSLQCSWGYVRTYLIVRK